MNVKTLEKLSVGVLITNLAVLLGVSVTAFISHIKASMKKRDFDRDPQKFKKAVLQKYPTATNMLQQLEGFWKELLRGGSGITKIKMYNDLEDITRMPDKQEQYEAYIDHIVRLNRSSEKLILAILLDESLVKKNRVEQSNFSERLSDLNERIENFGFNPNTGIATQAPKAPWTPKSVLVRQDIKDFKKVLDGKKAATAATEKLSFKDKLSAMADKLKNLPGNVKNYFKTMSPRSRNIAIVVAGVVGISIAALVTALITVSRKGKEKLFNDIIGKYKDSNSLVSALKSVKTKCDPSDEKAESLIKQLDSMIEKFNGLKGEEYESAVKGMISSKSNTIILIALTEK